MLWGHNTQTVKGIQTSFFLSLPLFHTKIHFWISRGAVDTMCKPTGLPGKNSERSLSRGGLWHIRGRAARLGPSPNSFLNQRQQTKRSELNVPLPLDSQKSCLHFMNWNLDQCTPRRESLPLIILKLHSSSCQQKSALAAYKCTLDCSVLEWPARFVKVWRFRVNPDQFSNTIGRYWCNLIKNSQVFQPFHREGVSILFITNKSVISDNLHDLSAIHICNCLAFSGDIIKPQ